MLALVIALVASSAPAVAAVDATCADGPACEAEAADQVEYATPAVIACHWTLASADLFGECDGTPHDASYRVSRFPDEQRTVELRPAARRERRGEVACDSLPPRGAELRLAPSQPAAMFAAPTLIPVPEDG